MDVTELLSAIEAGPVDAGTIEKTIQEAIAGGGDELLDLALEEVVPKLTKGESAETLLKALDQAFRRNRDTDAGKVLAWWAGVLAWHVLGDIVRAEFFMRAVGDAGRHSGQWVDFYREFYASRGNWLRLEQFISETSPRTGLSALEAKRVLARTAGQFNNPSKELSYWQAVVQAEPADREADVELERLYTQLERWPSLADLLKERLKSFDDGQVAEKVQVLEQMLAIYRDKMHAEPKVLSTYQMILDVDPANLAAIDALLERYEQAGRWPDYAKVLARKIEGTEDPAEQIRLREVQANLMETRFANALEALKAYEQILALAPERQDIIDKLKDLYEKRRDFEALIRLRRTEAERIDDPAKRAAVYVELAVTATERLRKFPVAIELWEKVLEIDDSNADALRNLEGLYEREKDVESLCRILQRRIDLADSDSERVMLLEKLAGIYGTKLNDSLAALETWKRILEVNPGHDRAKRELRARYLAEHRWDDLEWFLRKFGNVDELARTLESQVGSVTDPAEKVPLLFKLAGLWRDELAQPARAIKNLEGVLSLVPDDLRAATELIALYRSVADWRRLPPVYEIAIGKTGDRGERMRLMVEAAEVHERQLSNLDRAFFWYVEAYKEDMLDMKLRGELERLAGPSHNWDTYVSVLESAAHFMPDDARKVQTWLRVGEIHQAQLKQGEPALAAYKAALELDPENREAIGALESLYRELGNFDALIGILRRRLELERRREERKAVRFEIAATLYSKLHLVEDAVAAYEEILADQPDEARAYAELSELLLAERQFESLRELLTRQVDVLAMDPETQPEVLADVHARLGMLTFGIEGACAAAVRSLAQALTFAPHHPQALSLLEDLLAQKDLRLDVVALLRGPYEALRRWNDLADLLEIELVERGDGPETIEILWTLNDLYGDRAHDDEKRFRTLARIMTVTPDDSRAWDEIERVARRVDGWRDLAARYEAAATAIAEPATQVLVWLRLARVFLDELEQVDQARRVYHEVLELDDANADALEALETIYESTGSHPELLKVYKRRFEVSPYPGEKIAYAFKMAGELAEHLDDVEGAIASVKLVLDIDPEYASAYRQLDTLYTKAARWDDLAHVLEERIRLAEDDGERTYLRLRLAEVREEKLEDVDGAVAVYRTILETDGTNEDAIRQLERLFTNPDVRVGIASILLPAYKVREDWRKLVEVYDVMAGAESDLDRRLDHYDTIAGIYENRLRELEPAFEYRAKAFREAPEREELVAEVLRVGDARQATEDAVLTLVEKVYDIGDESRRKETHRTIARVCRDTGLDRGLAKAHFLAVLEMDDADMDALDSLIELYDQDGETEPLVKRLLAKAELLMEPAARAELLLWAGDLLASRLDQPEEAIGAYTGVLDLEPANLKAIEALEALYQKAERWDDLVEVLGRKASTATTDPGRIAALKKKGLTQHEHMGNTGDAIETFLEVHAIDPTDVDALRTLDRLYGVAEDWWNLFGILEKLLALVQGEDRLTVQYRMGRLLEKELGDAPRAVDKYEELLIEYPENTDAVDALEGMVRADEAAEAAFRTLGPVLSERGEWERLFAVYEVITDREEDVARKVANLLTMGEIAESRMGQPIRAFECYGRAFTTDPLNHEAQDRIDQLAAAHDMWDSVPELLLAGAKGVDGTPESLVLRLKAGGVHRDRLGNREEAARVFEAVVAEYPDNPRALSSLDALYADLQKWDDLARILRAEIDATQDLDGKVAFLLRLAGVCEDRLNKTRDALEARREVLYLRPADGAAVRELRRMFDMGRHRAEVLELLEPIYRDGAMWEDLATVYETSLGDIEDVGERKLVLLKLADTWLEKLGRKDVALGWFGKALELEPTDESLLIQIEVLASEVEAWAKLLDILLAAATAAEEDERRVYLWHKAVEVARDRLGDGQRAEAICRWILDVDPNDRTALGALDRMYETDARWADLLGVLERETEAADYDDEKVGFFLRAGALQRDRLNDFDGAVEAFRAILKIDEMHRGALEALSELHEVREEHAALFKVLGTLSDIAPSGTERAGLLRRMAKIAEANLEDPEKALELWDEVSRLEADDIDALRELERLYAAKGDWNQFVDTCERELPLVRDDAGRTVTLLRDVATAAEGELADTFQAQQAWRRILDVAPEDMDAMQALRRLYRESGDLEALSGILSRLADSGRLFGADVQALYEEHARLLTDELPRLDQAIVWWNRVLDLQPEHGEALASLDRLYEDTNRIVECVGTVKRRAALAGDAEARAALLVRASEMQSDRLKDAQGAAATLEEVAGFVPGSLDVSERLQTLYTRLEDWDKLADVLLRRDGILEDADARVANLAELARVYEDRKDDKLSAFLILVKSAQVNPGDDNTLADLWRLTQALAIWSDYVEAMADVVDRMPDGARQEHLARFGEVLWHEADRPADAVPWFEKVLADWPENETALSALTSLYSKLGRHERLVANLAARVELTPDYLEKIQLQLWAGRVLETDVRDSTRALAAFGKVLEFDEANLEALNALVRLHEGARSWEELLKVLALLAPLVPADEVKVRLRMGTLLEDKLAAPERAIQAYQEVLNLEPTQPDALDRLQALYGQLSDWRGLADVFERLLDVSSEVPDRILFCNRLAVLWEEALGDKRKALDYYQRILDLDPEDEEVFETCVRLLTEIEDWNELVNLYEAKVSRVHDAGAKISTLVRVAEVYEKRLEDTNAAISTWQRVLEADPGHIDGYGELTRLFGQTESWEDVVQTLLKWKEHVEDEKEFVDLLLRAATVVKERLENPDRAIKLLGDVLRVDPTNEAASEKLRLIYGELEDWEKVADVYLKQEPYVTGDDRKARLRASAGDVYANRLKDRPRAIQHYEKALELNPRLTDVALSLARSYVSAERWEKAEPLLDLLVGAPDVMSDPARAAEIHFQIGLCAEKLLDFERAFREYQIAVKTRGEHVPTILGLARLYQRKQLWQLAKDHYVKGLAKGTDLDDMERAAITFSLGEVSLELGELDDAVRYLDEVLVLTPNHGRAVELQIAIAERREDWGAVIRYRQAMVQTKVDPFERFAMFLEIGDLYHQKLHNVFGATAAYKEALELNPGAKVALLRLFELHLESGQIEDALFILERLAQAEESPEKRARHYVRMAAIYQEKLGDDARAIDYLNLALDADPDFLEAFRAIDEILTGKRAWEQQAENYRRMLERIQGRGASELEFRLFANLGEIHRSRLKQMEQAIDAYANASRLKPGERKTHEILAQLYEVTGDQVDKAIDEHRAIVSVAPLAADVAASYKAMRRLFLERKEFDKAFVTASVLVALRQADKEEQEFFEGNLEPTLPWFKGTIDPLRWESHVMAKAENTTLGRVLQVLYQGLGAELGAKELKDIGLKKKNLIDLDQKLLFVNAYKAVNKALGPLPHQVYRDENPTGLKIEFLSPPALVVGSDMLTGHDERDVAFHIGRQMTFLHPMHFLASVKNLTELKVFMVAVLKFSRPATQVTAGADVVTEVVKLIERRMPQQQKNQLQKLVEDLVSRNPQLNFGALFEEYFRAMELTSLRAGTLVCGNVPSVLDVLRTEEVSFSGMPQKDRMEEVVRFALSEDHFILRRALGVAVGEAG